MAFNDAKSRPSVDIASLCNHDPNYTSRLRGPGVLGIIASQVRTISSKRVDNGVELTYYADVEPVPLVENPAHAEIYGKPPFGTSNLFRRIKEALARESVWLIEPDSY